MPYLYWFLWVHYVTLYTAAHANLQIKSEDVQIRSKKNYYDYQKLLKIKPCLAEKFAKQHSLHRLDKSYK